MSKKVIVTICCLLIVLIVAWNFCFPPSSVTVPSRSAALAKVPEVHAHPATGMPKADFQAKITFYQNQLARGDEAGFQSVIDELSTGQDMELQEALVELLLSVRNNKNVIRPVVRRICHGGAGDAYTVILEMQKHYVNPTS